MGLTVHCVCRNPSNEVGWEYPIQYVLERLSKVARSARVIAYFLRP